MANRIGRFIGTYAAGLLVFIGTFNSGNAAEALSLTLDISGQIRQHCALSNMPSEIADLKQGVSSQIKFNINCNTPFKYNLTSKNGGLRLQGSPSTANTDGFDDISEYLMTIKIPLQQGDKREIVDHCTSKELLEGASECQFSDSGDSIAINSQATLSLTPDNTRLLIAGNYSDALILEISVY